MDIRTASGPAPTSTGTGGPRRAVAVVPADAEGIDRRPFWSSSVLRGAESEELCLTNVAISDAQLFFPEVEESLDAVEAGGFLLIVLPLSPPHLGGAPAPAGKGGTRKRGDGHERKELHTAE